MTAMPLVERPVGAEAWSAPTPFLDTLRATAACKRELDRLNEDVVTRLDALHAQGIGDKSDVRLSPDRCIVQFGPVALSIAWLRNARLSVADGELLVIVWRGVAGRRVSLHPERRGKQQPPSAVALWEEVLTAEATDEATWTWRSRRAGGGASTSLQLAERCVQLLRDACLASPSTDG